MKEERDEPSHHFVVLCKVNLMGTGINRRKKGNGTGRIRGKVERTIPG